MKIVEQQVMKEYSNMKIGGKAKRLIIVDSREEMKEVYQKYDSLILLGNGTNVLFSDGCLDYNFVSTEHLNKIETLEDGRVLVEAGVDLEALLRSEEHTSELQSRQYLVCRLLLEKKKNIEKR